jgi:hypothetical protein
MGTAVFLNWAEVVFKLVAIACGAVVFMAVHERSTMWREAARRLWAEATPEDGGPVREPSTLNAKALAKSVGYDFKGTDDPDRDDFLVAMTLPKTFEAEAHRIIKEAQERLKRFKRAPENRSRLNYVRGERGLYLVSQTVLVVVGCILVTAFFWADFAWQGASALSVARGGSDLGWGDHMALFEIDMETACSPKNCALEGSCPAVCKSWH